MLSTSVSNCINLVRRHGLGSTIALYWNRLRERMPEGRLGIRSDGIISLKELGLEHEERRGHYPTQFSDFRLMEKFLRPKTPNEVFIDYGAGLGRAVILAALLPFKRVIGIEISPMLAERARENVSRCKSKLRCEDIKIINADAATFEVPADASTFFFNYPFVGTILTNVLDKIQVSYKQRPRPIKLICNLPAKSAFRDQICRAKAFELQREVPLGEGRQCLVFSIRPGPKD
jgi:SAM-dependent methyltransferase